MWWAGSEVLRRKGHDVYVGTRAFAAFLGPERVLARAVPDVDGALRELHEWLANSPRRLRLRVWLSGGLCRPFIMAPVPGVRGAAELKRVAAVLASRQTGLDGDCVVWLDRGNLQSSRVAVAVQRISLDRLHQTAGGAAGRRHHIVSIRPWGADLLRSVMQRDAQTPVVAAQDCDSLTVLVGRGGEVSVASTSTPVVDRQAADAALARFLLSATDVPDGPRTLARLLPFHEEPLAQQGEIALSPFVEWAP